MRASRWVNAILSASRDDKIPQAYADGADYFYMVNDDLLLLTHGWADRFVDGDDTSYFAAFDCLQVLHAQRICVCLVFAWLVVLLCACRKPVGCMPACRHPPVGGCTRTQHLSRAAAGID